MAARVPTIIYRYWPQSDSAGKIFRGSGAILIALANFLGGAVGLMVGTRPFVWLVNRPGWLECSPLLGAREQCLDRYHEENIFSFELIVV